MASPTDGTITTQPAPAPAPSPAPSVPAGAGGVSAAPPAGQPAGGGGTQSFGDQLRGAAAAAGLNGQAPAAGPTPSAAAQQQAVTGAPPTPQPGETVESLRARIAEYEAAHAQYQHYLPWAEFGRQAYLQNQQRQNQPQQTQAQPPDPLKNPFGIPEFDRNILQFFQEDPKTGQVVPTPYAPPGAGLAFKNWQAKREEAIESLLSDPFKALGPGIQHLIQQEAQKIATGSIQQTQRQAFAENYIDQNRQWIYEHDQGGRPVRDPFTGQEKYSPAGKLFHETVMQLRSAGVNDPQLLQKFAEDHVLGVIAMQRHQQTQTAQQQSAAANQQLLQRGQQQAPVTGPTTPPNPAAPVPSVPDGPISTGNALRRMMTQAAQAQGVPLDQPVF